MNWLVCEQLTIDQKSAAAAAGVVGPEFDDPDYDTYNPHPSPQQGSTIADRGS